jgi:hypothetical protein
LSHCGTQVNNIKISPIFFPFKYPTKCSQPSQCGVNVIK